jgi:hypothetical protein
MKKLILLLPLSLWGVTTEFYQLYKDIEVMKMGGVNIGLGGENSAIFYNPAGLSKIKASDGFEVKMVNSNLSTNSKVAKLIRDSDDIFEDIPDHNGDGVINDKDETIEILKRAGEDMGKNANFDGSNFSSVGKKIGPFGFSVGFLTSLDINIQPHRGFGSEGLLEVDGLFLNGVALGTSYDVSSSLSVGVGLKSLQYASLQRDMRIDEVLNSRDDFIKYLDNKIAKKGNSTAFDLGILYRLNRYANVGLSGMNLGGVGDSSAIEIPPTLNIGVGAGGYTGYKYIPEFRFGLDYVDITREQESGGHIKRLRSGVEVSIIDSPVITFKIAGGLYQGYYTLGTTLRLALFKVGFATYAEEIGVTENREEDRRYIINVAVGW